MPRFVVWNSRLEEAMELIRGLHNIKPEHHGCVATIGNFDGVHLGHQAVIGQLTQKAGELRLPSLLMTFEPQPLEYFSEQRGITDVPPRLTRFREKIQALKRFALERVLCVTFDAQFASLSAEDFITRVLVAGLGVKYLVVGDDFRFGAGRQGDFAMLQAAGEEHGFQVVNMHSFLVDSERVSSTRIRQALESGDMGTAEKLLGRPYRMSGRVAHGDKRGRELGYPTANIHIHRKAAPVAGIFAVEVYGLEREPIAGAASIGTRPTVDGTTCILEVYLLDFSASIYGRHVHVNFLKKLRDELKFDSLDELKDAMAEDVRQVRDFFNSLS